MTTEELKKENARLREKIAEMEAAFLKSLRDFSRDLVTERAEVKRLNKEMECQ